MNALTKMVHKTQHQQGVVDAMLTHIKHAEEVIPHAESGFEKHEAVLPTVLPTAASEDEAAAAIAAGTAGSDCATPWPTAADGPPKPAPRPGHLAEAETSA